MRQKIGAVCTLAMVLHVMFWGAPLPAMAYDVAKAAELPRHIMEGGKSGGGGSSCEIEACNRKKDRKKRPECYNKANQKHAKCRRECEKKFPPKD
jgi:dsDNA-specific endonuclease/ATPase MutS2